MNEPFKGGYKDTVQSSVEANIHKRKVENDEYEKERLAYEQMPDNKRTDET